MAEYCKLTSFFFLPLFFSIVSAEIPIKVSLGRDFKESCSPSEPCNYVKFLECVRGRCECISSNEIFYDPKSEVCVARVGYSCMRQIPGEQKVKRSFSNFKNGTEEGTKNDETLIYQISCVPNARCSPEDLCQCDFRHFMAPNATCLHQKGHGERCSGDEQCDDFSFLTCSGGICGCDRNHRYDAKNDQCIVSVGAACTVNNIMTINEERFENDECPEDATCTDGLCQCNPGLKLTMDKTCGRDFGDSCSNERKCSDVQFICRSGKCGCKYPLHQNYDEGTKRCVSFSGGPCQMEAKTAPERTNQTTPPEPLMGCTENSVCVENPPFHYCKCKPGFVETNEGKCLKGHGQSCVHDEECDPLPNLACINNRCNCPDALQSYDEKHRACVSLAGGRCKKEMNGTLSTPSCTPNAYCIKANANLEYGRCICARGTQTTGSRTCSKSN